MKALVGFFNQEKALVGAFSVIVKANGSFAALDSIDQIWGSIIRSAALNPLYSSWAQGDWSGDVIKRLLFPGPGLRSSPARDQNKSGRNIPRLAWAGQQCTGGGGGERSYSGTARN